MPIVILPLRGTSGDYDPPAEFVYVDVNAARAAEMCDLVELVRSLRERPGILRLIWSISSFASPACPFNKWFEPDPAQLTDLEFPELSLEEFLVPDTDEVHDYFLLPGDVEVGTDTDDVRTGTDLIHITEDGVFFELTCKHSDGAGETPILGYDQLAAWCDPPRAQLPGPARARSRWPL